MPVSEISPEMLKIATDAVEVVKEYPRTEAVLKIFPELSQNNDIASDFLFSELKRIEALTSLQKLSDIENGTNLLEKYLKNFDEVSRIQALREIGRTSSVIEQQMRRLDAADKLKDAHSWIKEINPNLSPDKIVQAELGIDIDKIVKDPYMNNCGACTISVFSRLEGVDGFVATKNNIKSLEEMTAITGREFVNMTPEMIEQYLIDQGSGSHAMIGVYRAAGSGHFFNAANIDGRIVALDGQDGSIAPWPPDYGNVTEWHMSV